LNEPHRFARSRPAQTWHEILDVREIPLVAGFHPAVALIFHPLDNRSDLQVSWISRQRFFKHHWTDFPSFHGN
jgi:hypothetical protein